MARETLCITCGREFKGSIYAQCGPCWRAGFRAPRLATVDDAYVDHQLANGNPEPARREAEERQRRIEDALA